MSVGINCCRKEDSLEYIILVLPGTRMMSSERGKVSYVCFIDCVFAKADILRLLIISAISKT